MTIADRIIAAIKAGAVTSAQISAVVRVKQQTIAVHLCDLANQGRVSRVGTSPRDDAGRTFVLWGLPNSDPCEGNAPQESKFLAVLLIEEQQLVQKLTSVRAVIAAYSPSEARAVFDPAPPVVEIAPLPVAGSGAENEPATIPIREAEAAPAVEPDREASVERRKAWLRGEAPEAAEVSHSAAPAAVEQAPVDLQPPPSKAAPELPQAVGTPSRNASEGIKRAAMVFRAAELGAAGVSYRRADPPAEKRGVVNVTSAFAGDPPPGRSALDQRQGTAR